MESSTVACVTFFTLPTEATQADQWHWEERYPRFAALASVDEAIKRFEEFVEGLPDGAEEQKRS